MKKLATLSLLAVAAMAITACGPSVKDYDGTEVQGINETTILVGNTAATTGAFATVGVPFNDGLKAALKVYNDAGGFKGKKVELKHYDDGFDGAVGYTYTKQLVEDDKVFALLGHFGTNTVVSTVDYIKEKGIPMFYGVTGVPQLYQEKAEGYNRSVMSVQPIFSGEGKVLLARALAAKDGGIGLGGSKVGVISTTDDVGLGMKEAIKVQAKSLKNGVVTYVETQAEAGTNHAAAVQTLKNAGVDTIIIAANQVPFGEILTYIKDAGIKANILTSYLSANAVTLGQLEESGAINADRPTYTNAWLDITSEKGMTDYLAYAATCFYYYGVDQSDVTNPAWQDAFNLGINSYAMAGFVAGAMFTEALKRVDEANKDLTWKNFIDEVEDGRMNVPMGGSIDFSEGKRHGITDLALNRANKNSEGGAGLDAVDGIRTLDEIWAKIPASLLK